MSHRGDDDGFHPHPGDPWHPGWSSEGEAERERALELEPETPATPADHRAPASEGRAAAEPRRRRLGWGRHRERPEAAGPETPAEAEVGQAAPQVGELSDWWASESPVGETAWQDPGAAPTTSGAGPEEDAEAAPAPPLFPWWEAAAPTAPAPPATAPAPVEEAFEEKPAPRRQEPSAASVVPLDLPEAPAIPLPFSAAPPPGEPEPPAWWEEAAGTATPDLPSRPAIPPPFPGPPQTSEPEPPAWWEETSATVAADLPEPAATPPGPALAADEVVAPAGLDDELARATAALLAEIGGETQVEPREEIPGAPEVAGSGALPGVAPGPEAAASPASEAGPVPPEGRSVAPEPREAGGEVVDLLVPSWSAEPAAVGEEDFGVAATGLVLPSWEPPADAAKDAAASPGGSPPSGEGEEPGPLGAEGEVDDWLAFVEGLPAGERPAARPAARPVIAPEPAVDWEMEGEGAPSASARPRRRGWFGRRRRAGQGEEEWPERAWAGEGEGEGGEEAHEPPPWPATTPAAAVLPEAVPLETVLPEAVPTEEEAVVPVYDEAGEAEAAWAAWEAGGTMAAAEEAAAAPDSAAAGLVEPPADRGGAARAAERLPGGPAVAPPFAFTGRAVPAEEAAEPFWEEGEWAGEPEAPSGERWGEVDEDEVEVPPAVLPEEEWEGAGELWPDAPAGPVAPVEDLAAAGWEVFPEPGKPLPSETGAARPAPAGDEAAAAPEPEAGAERWETFPEPRTPAPRWRAEEAPAFAGPVPGPEPVFPEGEEGDEAEWGEGEPEPSFYEEEAPSPPRPGIRPFVGEPTLEMPPPAFDFERPPRRQGPINEESLTGAVTMEHRGLAEEVAAADTAETELQALSAPMPGLESGVVGFEDVAHLSTEEEMAAPVRSDLPVRVVTGMVLAALLLGSLWVGGEFLAGFVGLMVMLGLGEFYGSLRRRGYQPLALFGFPGAIGILVGTWFYGPVAIPVATVATMVLSFFYYAFAPRRRDALTNGGLTLLGMLWVTATAAFAFPIAAAPHFRVLVLAMAATVIATDVGAFFTGRAWGARLMAPVLSPHKTWEGLAGGVVLGIGAAVAAGYFFDEIGVRAGAALGLVVAVMAPLGDLAESMVKRSLGVKDMGSILPGHGGILDRIDAFLFVLPAAWVLFETMGLLR